MTASRHRSSTPRSNSVRRRPTAPMRHKVVGGSRLVKAAGRGPPYIFGMESPVPRSAEVRLAELVALLSLGTDLGLGQPMEHMIRACLIALRLAESASLDASERGV